ncbi:MAG: aspartoacylase [Fibrobacteria bacterium]|nr:aspartoacylase [Fibrobacteria bacterium]
MPVILPRGQNTHPRNVSRVVIMGGTHGNERVGVHALQYILTHTFEFAKGSVNDIYPLFGNPPAIRRNSRYIETDLNRCFTYDYANPRLSCEDDCFLESRRAFEIRNELGANTQPVDFLIDMHTTTSNMGNCLIIADIEPWTLALCRRVAAQVMGCRIVYDPCSREEDKNSSSLAVNSITLEMGPFQQGVADSQGIHTALSIVKVIISVLDELNGKSQDELKSPEGIPIFQTLPFSVDYPRDENKFNTCFIHEKFMHQDYVPLQSASLLFRSYDGGEVRCSDTSVIGEALLHNINRGEELSAIFVGESAYVEKGIAFIPVVKKIM